MVLPLFGISLGVTAGFAALAAVKAEGFMPSSAPQCMLPSCLASEHVHLDSFISFPSRPPYNQALKGRLRCRCMSNWKELLYSKFSLGDPLHHPSLERSMRDGVQSDHAERTASR